MFALKGLGSVSGIDPADGRPRGGRFVLPRLVRRPVRLFARLGTGDFVPPRFAATMASGLLFAATGLYGTWVGGHMPEVAQAVTARTGFAVDQIRVVGHRETSEIDVLDKLELTGWTSLVGFDVNAARDRVATLPWVEGVSVRKIYPEMIEVKIEERKPFAIWQRNGELSIIGEKGNVIVPYAGGRWGSILPVVVGPGAAEKAATFVHEVEAYPDLASRVRAYVLVGGRRWDLRLDNGMVVKLPEADAGKAITTLLEMDRHSDVFGRDLLAVDMRLSDRMVVQLSADAAEARADAISKAAKAKKANRT